MTKKIDYLEKVRTCSNIPPANESKTLDISKKRINNICKSIMFPEGNYRPELTVKSVNAYINEQNKIDRLLYSEISAYISSLDEEERGVFSHNIERLLLYVINPDYKIREVVRKICIKIYDHFQLNLIQFERANSITSEATVASIAKEKEDLHKEIKGIEKEHITILGIFASIMLAFVGSFTFSTSVLKNIPKQQIYELVIVAAIIGLIFVILITILLDFLREINDKTLKDENGKKTDESNE